ncbi:hypothetical protein J6Y73_01600 [bacterium]|nr:hypothetical protein [bacterium]
METKHDKFQRLAEARMNNCLKQIELLKNLSNKSAYEYEDDEIKRMISTLKSAIKELESTYFDTKSTKKFQL